MSDNRRPSPPPRSADPVTTRRQVLRTTLATMPLLLTLKARPAFGHGDDTSGLSGMSRQPG